MSEVRNDPRGLKQKGAAAAFLAAGFLLVLFSGTGAVLECNGECVVRRREVFHKSEDRFSRAGFTGIRTSVESTSNVQGRRGAASTNLILQADGREIPVFASAVGWVFGPMGYAGVEAARGSGAPFRIHGVSIGGVSLVIAATLFLIGIVLVILAAAVPIQGKIDADLAYARRRNLGMLAVVLLAAGGFCTGFLVWFFKFLT